MNTSHPKGYLQNYWSSWEGDSENEPQKKRQKLAPKQVCIVSNCGRKAYDIIVADIDSLCNKSYLARSSDGDDNEFIPVRPAIRLKLGEDYTSDYLLSFCGLGSTLFVFESTPHKSAYAIDLSPFFSNSNDLTKPTLLLKRRNNKRIRDMIHPKKHPWAIPTPDSKKILLFSRLVSDDPGVLVGANDFELYDPETDTWQQLPGISSDWCDSRVKINSFTFIGASTFFIETDHQWMFALNLECIDRGWQSMDTFYGARSASPRGQQGRFFVVEEHLCVNAQVAYDIHKQVRNPFGFAFPRPSLGIGYYYYKPLLFHLLDEEEEEEKGEDGKYNFCTLVSGISTSTNIPHLSFNVTACDLSRYKWNKNGSDQDYEELDRCMTVCDSIRFCLHGEPSPDFNPLCFFSIPA